MATSSSERLSFLSRLGEPEMLVALSAVLLGLCALVVSVVQVQMMHEQQHASAWPRLDIMPSYNTADGLGIHVTNPGIGPAVIHYVKASVDGESAANWSRVFTTLLPDFLSDEMIWSTVRDRIIPPGGEVEALRIRNATESASMLREIGGFELEICYCSVYSRCWSVTGIARRTPPVAVAPCPAPDEEMFIN
jgi:hypothetical protein